MGDARAAEARQPLSAETDVKAMFDRIAHRYDAANRVMSLGIDVRWRNRALAAFRQLPGDATLLDLGAGTLDGAAALLRRHPGARVVAADFASAMLRAGQSKLAGHPQRAAVHQADGHALPYRTGAFDGVFTAFCVRNLVQLDRAAGELARVLRPGGVLAVLEFFRPARTRLLLDAVYNRHVLPLVGWAITGDRAAYRYLPRSIAQFDSTSEFAARLRAAGFDDVAVTDLFPAGVASLVVARRAPGEAHA